MRILDGVLLFDSDCPFGEVERVEVFKTLYPLTISLIDLGMHVKHAHWNVRGHGGFPAHKLFDRLYASVLEQTDLLAERCGFLGCYMPGVAPRVVEDSLLEEYPLDAVSPGDHFKALGSQFASLSTHVARAVIETASYDPATSNLLADAATELQRSVFFLNLNTPQS